MQARQGIATGYAQQKLGNAAGTQNENQAAELQRQEEAKSAQQQAVQGDDDNGSEQIDLTQRLESQEMIKQCFET